jgi:hypothetical protein
VIIVVARLAITAFHLGGQRRCDGSANAVSTTMNAAEACPGFFGDPDASSMIVCQIIANRDAFFSAAILSTVSRISTGKVKLIMGVTGRPRCSFLVDFGAGADRGKCGSTKGVEQLRDTSTQHSRKVVDLL